MGHRNRFVMCCCISILFSCFAFAAAAGVERDRKGNVLEIVGSALILSALLPASSFAMSVLEVIDNDALIAARLKQPGRSPHKPDDEPRRRG